MPIVEYGADGRIIHVIGTHRPNCAAVMRDAGKTVLERSSEDVSMDKNFVCFHPAYGAVIAIRPDMTFQVDKKHIKPDGFDAALITGLPDPCTLLLTDEIGDVQAHEITGGSLEFTVETAGRYSLTFEAWPYLPKTIEISTVTPPKGSENTPDMWEEKEANNEA